MDLEQLEFAISQHLDGHLSPEETAALDARLRDDPVARELLEEYRSLDSFLKVPGELPAINWDQLSSHMASTMADHHEQFEFALSQLADGTLHPDGAPHISDRAAADPSAQAMLDEHRALTQLLKTPVELAGVRWDRLQKHLSRIIANAAASTSESRPLKLFSNRLMRSIGGLALAASVLLAMTLGIRSAVHNHVTKPSEVVTRIQVGSNPTTPAADSRPVKVEVGAPEVPGAANLAGPIVAEISFGAGPDAVDASVPQSTTPRSPRSLIASSAPVIDDGAAQDQDALLMPY